MPLFHRGIFYLAIRQKIIVRLVDPNVPTNVSYESTDYCKSFGDIILAMIQWGTCAPRKD